MLTIFLFQSSSLIHPILPAELEVHRGTVPYSPLYSLLLTEWHIAYHVECFCVCVSVDACTHGSEYECVCAHTHIHPEEGQRLTLGIFFSPLPPSLCLSHSLSPLPIPLKQDLSPNMTLAILFKRLASKLLRCSCFGLPMLGFRHMWPWPALCVSAGDLNTGHQASTASTLTYRVFSLVPESLTCYTLMALSWSHWEDRNISKAKDTKDLLSWSWVRTLNVVVGRLLSGRVLTAGKRPLVWFPRSTQRIYIYDKNIHSTEILDSITLYDYLCDKAV